jgi:hypothetical protein
MLRSIQAFFQYVFGAIERLNDVSPYRVIRGELPGDRLEAKDKPLPGLKHRFLKRVRLIFHRRLFGFRAGLLPDLSPPPTP